MANELLDKMEDNAVVRVWSEKTQLEKGDSLTEGYTSELWDFAYIKVEEHLFRALAQFWNFAYSCFTFGKVDLVPTVKEYTILLRCPRIQAAHPDIKKKVDVFALSIYGLIIFPKALGHIDEGVTDLFDQLNRRVTPLLLVWFHSHFWKVDKVSYRVFSENYSPLKELAATPRRDDIIEERWMAIFRNLQDEDVEWRAPWRAPK
ncbi:hypothetical protein Goshw_019073 [Gossypium schwendimanii]|uniref:DUF7745 domain-containing protein n=1 Tax=Gossypium schwendimanii TaxID=34291 RepID=A0A7J9KYG9_GOSSC|nr:hypothetical protein [Gossypium schwendimanii]